MRILAIVFAAWTLSVGAGAAPVADVQSLDWLAGDWIQQTDAGLVQESWMPPRAGIMLGMSRTTSNDHAKLFEFARISQGRNGRISFFAQPGGVPPTEFPVTKLEVQSVTFENAGHDYPNRVRYWREGDRLMAEISGKNGENLVRWSYTQRR